MTKDRGNIGVEDVVTTPYQAVLFFGYPGCGKGTQGLTLAGMPNLYHLAMGDIFRGLDTESPTGMEFLSYAAKGQLAPDSLTLRVWQEQVEAKVDAGEIDPNYHVLILDGIPRTSSQVEQLSQLVNVRKIIHLKMDDRSKLIKRLKARASKSNRPDDTQEDVIRNRIRVYEKQTLPVLACYDDALIANINADQSPLAVLSDISHVLAPVIPANI